MHMSYDVASYALWYLLPRVRFVRGVLQSGAALKGSLPAKVEWSQVFGVHLILNLQQSGQTFGNPKPCMSRYTSIYKSYALQSPITTLKTTLSFGTPFKVNYLLPTLFRQHFVVCWYHQLMPQYGAWLEWWDGLYEAWIYH